MSAPDLDDLYDELQRGKVYECSLRDPSAILDGLQSGEAIYIDPRPAIIETLVHELLHRHKPRWCERRVNKEARALLSRMTESDLATWYRRYNAVKRKARPLNVEKE